MQKKDTNDSGYLMFDSDRRIKSGIEHRESSIDELPFASNCVRLSLADWLIVAIILSAIIYLVSMLWERVEKFTPSSDYRIPYDLSIDYWLYERYCRWACLRYETLVLGDSVIWGHFVSEHNTLSHYLNEIAGRNKFANMGV